MQIKSLNELTEENEVDADDLLLIQKAHVQGNPSRKIKSASVKNYLRTFAGLEEIEPTADENARVTRHYKLIMSDGEALKDEENNFVILDIPEGAGIQNVNYTQSNEDDGNNKISFTLTDGSTTPQFDIKNGSRGNGIESFETTESADENGRKSSSIKITATDGQETNINVQEGIGVKVIEVENEETHEIERQNEARYEETVGSNLISKTFVKLTDGSELEIHARNGESGRGFNISKTYPSIEEMNSNRADDIENEAIIIGDFVMIRSDTSDPDNAKLFYVGETENTYIADLSGAQGLGISGIELAGAFNSESGATNNYVIKADDKNQSELGTISVKNGEKGDKGDKGDRGDIGSASVTKYTINSSSALPDVSDLAEGEVWFFPVVSSNLSDKTVPLDSNFASDNLTQYLTTRTIKLGTGRNKVNNGDIVGVTKMKVTYLGITVTAVKWFIIPLYEAKSTANGAVDGLMTSGDKDSINTALSRSASNAETLDKNVMKYFNDRGEQRSANLNEAIWYGTYTNMSLGRTAIDVEDEEIVSVKLPYDYIYANDLYNFLCDNGFDFLFTRESKTVKMSLDNNALEKVNISYGSTDGGYYKFTVNNTSFLCSHNYLPASDTYHGKIFNAAKPSRETFTVTVTNKRNNDGTYQVNQIAYSEMNSGKVYHRVLTANSSRSALIEERCDFEWKKAGLPFKENFSKNADLALKAGFYSNALVDGDLDIEAHWYAPANPTENCEIMGLERIFKASGLTPSADAPISIPVDINGADTNLIIEHWYSEMYDFYDTEGVLTSTGRKDKSPKIRLESGVWIMINDPSDFGWYGGSYFIKYTEAKKADVLVATQRRDDDKYTVRQTAFLDGNILLRTLTADSLLQTIEDRTKWFPPSPTPMLKRIYFEFSSGDTQTAVFEKIATTLGGESKMYFCDSEDVTRIHLTSTSVIIRYFNAANATDPATMTCTNGTTTTIGREFKFYVKKWKKPWE